MMLPELDIVAIYVRTAANPVESSGKAYATNPQLLPELCQPYDDCTQSGILSVPVHQMCLCWILQNARQWATLLRRGAAVTGIEQCCKNPFLGEWVERGFETVVTIPCS